VQLTGTVVATTRSADPPGGWVRSSPSRDRHLADAAVRLACVDPFEERTTSGSDPPRLLDLCEHLADPPAPARLLVSAEIDDDLAVQAADTGEWLAARPHVPVVAPDLFAGLTHEQLDEIEAWL
jgi:hypothetical protein